MNIQEIRRLNDEELAKELAEAYREVMMVRFRLATRQITNVHEGVRVRKHIARVKTVQRERELGVHA